MALRRALPTHAMPLGFEAWNEQQTLQVRSMVQPLFDYHESGCDPQSDRVYDATGAVAVRRVKVA